LVPGTVDRLKLGETNFNAVLQVMQVSRKNEIGLTLGDGNKCIDAVLPPNLAHVVADGHVKESSYVVVTSCFCTTVDQKAVLILMGLEVFDETAGSRSKEAMDVSPDDVELPQKLNRKSKSFGQGSRDWFDTMPVLLNSSLSKEIAKAMADGADIEKILPSLLQGKLYETVKNTVEQPQRGIFDYVEPPEDAPMPAAQRKTMKDDEQAKSRTKQVPASRQSLGAAPARSSVATAVKSRQSVGAAPRVLKKSEVEQEADHQHQPEEKKRGLFGRLFGLGKSHDSHPKGVGRSLSVGQVKSKGSMRAKSKISHRPSNDDDDVLPPPEEDYVKRK